MWGFPSRLLPWKTAVRRLARAGGFLDPIAMMARLRAFGQPSEVGEPLELLRSGAAFHARGLFNARAIQNNLDWIWPFWVRRQFDPADVSFVPRAFSFSHINLTHRNWTALGCPDHPVLPIVDPAGLVTPFVDGWSVDAWILGADELIPSAAHALSQTLELEANGLAVVTVVQGPRCGLEMRAEVLAEGRAGRLRLRYQVQGRPGEHGLVVSLRPCNPEGVSFVDTLEWDAPRQILRVNGRGALHFESAPQRVLLSPYRHGDVAAALRGKAIGASPPSVASLRLRDAVGMGTAAVVFPLPAPGLQTVTVTMDLDGEPDSAAPFGLRAGTGQTWSEALHGTPRLRVPDAKFVFLYDAAVRSLLLHCQGSVVPGPFAYKRFWFRDAAFILNALLALGSFARVREVLNHYPAWQTRDGYFLSQNGEWDSNGEALWILHRYLQLSGAPVPADWIRAVGKGAEWIRRKRRRASAPAELRGLFPAGMSAEHFGPNDYFYWDDFWGAAGLSAAADISDASRHGSGQSWHAASADFLDAIAASIKHCALAGSGEMVVPASPYRRLDSAAIGVLAASYPLQLWPATDARVLGTAEFLYRRCRVRGGFFQDMVHSGVNAYLTLHLAQTFLRAGDAERFRTLLQATADLASPTGQWPEAIHPHTRGGCMGDGQHVWASAEWVMALRMAFLREEGETLVLGSGLFPEWLQGESELSFGEAPCIFGSLQLDIGKSESAPVLRWKGKWRRPPHALEIKLPGMQPERIPSPPESGEIKLKSISP